MPKLRDIEAAIPKLNAEELAELAELVKSEQLRKRKVEWPDFQARLNRIFPDGPPPGKPLSEIVVEGRGDS